MPFVELSSKTSLHYQFHRGGQVVNDLDSSKNTVVFLHAIYTSSESWRPQLDDPRLSSLYNLVTFDQKYHGKSTGVTKLGYNFQDAAMDIAEAMDKIGIPPAHFIGESNFGCRPLVHLATLRPDLMRSFVLISPGVIGAESEDTKATLREIMEGMMAANRLYQSGTVPEEDVHLPREFKIAYGNYHFSQVLPPEEIDRALEHMEKYHARAPPEQNFEIKSMHIHQSEIPGVEKITMPVLLLRGSRNETNESFVSEELWKNALVNSSNLEFHYIHGAPLRANACFPYLVTRFLVGWLAKNSGGKQRFAKA